MTDVMFLYTTFPDEAAAATVATALVEERLAACANILPGMKSVYRWKGRVETANETVMIVKTNAAAADAAKEKILALHPDETPCIAAAPVSAAGSNPEFLDWVRSQIRDLA